MALERVGAGLEPGLGGLVEEWPGPQLPVREEVDEELGRVVLVQEVMPVQESEALGQMKFAQKEGKVARTLGVMEAGEWKLIVAMALASMLNLQLQ